jgi:hypothetical protein
MTTTSHIDRQTATIDGVTFKNRHSGQKRRYGNSFYEYEITSDLPADEVERVCREKVNKAISVDQWSAEYKANPTMDNYFRNHYRFTRRGDGKYFYSVCSPYAD